MNLNPEFQRQLQLEFSSARLVGVPLILGIIFTLTYILDNQTSYQTNITAQTALGLFLLMVSFWGARQAVDSVLDEQRSHTWDTQCLSALDPWTMVCGKLFGSTLVVWYGCVICLLVYGFMAQNTSNLFWVLSYALTSGLLVQNLSLLLSLLALRKGKINSNSVIIGLAILGALSIGSFVMPLSQAPDSLQHTPATWYGVNTTAHFLTLISVCLALFWCMVGNYRLMAQELRIRTLPWVWLAFAVFLIIYQGGFIAPNQFGEYFYSIAFGICFTLSYLIAFAEHHEPMRIKRLFTYIAQENWLRSAEELPLWCVTFVLAGLLAIPLSFARPADIEELHVYPMSILLLLLRDIGIFLFFSYSKNPQRAFSLTLLSLVLLYGVLPGIFAAAKQHWLAALFFPLVADNMVISIVCMGVQSAVIWYFLYQRWQESV
ncbi:MAG: hypothetical protein EXR80_10795 [Methylococcales bacterium]|nr:hypothetical protein [Methylococcales bacterium]